MYLCIACDQEEHDECIGCDCGDTGHYGTMEVIDQNECNVIARRGFHTISNAKTCNKEAGQKGNTLLQDKRM